MRFVPVAAVFVGMILLVAAAFMVSPAAGVATAGVAFVATGLFGDFGS